MNRRSFFAKFCTGTGVVGVATATAIAADKPAGVYLGPGSGINGCTINGNVYLPKGQPVYIYQNTFHGQPDQVRFVESD